MTTNKFPFKVLFCFENESQIILEIKRTDIQSEDKSLVYKWLKITKTPLFLEQLHFQSMDSSSEKQRRGFAEGDLSWDSHSALFNDEQLATVSVEEVSKEWFELVAGFLN